MKAKKVPVGHDAAVDRVASEEKQQGDGHGSDEVHERRADGLGAHRAEVGAEETARGLAEAEQLPELHVEGFDDAVAGDGFVQDVLDFGELVLAFAGGLADAAADFADRSR